MWAAPYSGKAENIPQPTGIRLWAFLIGGHVSHGLAWG